MDQVKQMRADGHSLQEIATTVGMSYQAVRKALDPDGEKVRRQRDNAKRAADKRAWENANDRPACESCGKAMGAGAHRHGYTSCWDCRLKRAEERTAEMVRLRNEDGLSNREIAERIGSTLCAVATELSRARRRGEHVAHDPYMLGVRRALDGREFHAWPERPPRRGDPPWHDTRHGRPERREGAP